MSREGKLIDMIQNSSDPAEAVEVAIRVILDFLRSGQKGEET